jgi:hypothetical protein
MRNKETDMTLEKRIETAIAENTDPFTTDADIRFFETEEWNDEVTLGTKIIGDFGGYEPLWEGEIVTISPISSCPALTPEVKIKWDDGSYSWCELSFINANKGIGYFTEEGYYG